MIYDYVLGLLVYLVAFALIGFAIYVSGSAWALLGLLLVPRLVVTKDGKAGHTIFTKERQ
jgi:hypothetical protein